MKGVEESAIILTGWRIAEEWRSEGMSDWDQGQDTWHDDPNWIAWFALSCEVSNQAHEWCLRHQGLYGTQLWGEIARIADRLAA